MGRLAERFRLHVLKRSPPSRTDASEYATIYRDIAEMEDAYGRALESPRAIAALKDVCRKAEARTAAAEQRAEEAELEMRKSFAAIALMAQREWTVLDLPEKFDDFDRIVVYGSRDGTSMRPIIDAPAPAESGIRIVLMCPNTPPTIDLLEHRATELIEAGEKLLAQYRAELEKAKAEADRLGAAKELTARIVAAVADTRQRGVRMTTLRMCPADIDDVLAAHGLARADGVPRILDVPALADETVKRGTFDYETAVQR